MGKELWKVFWTFCKIGGFTFGGGYAMIPLIQHEAVEKHHWVTEEDILEIVAIAESTPGPIAINAATFVGYRKAGIWGGICATLGVILPSFLAILAISGILREFQENLYVAYAFRGIRAGVLALVLKALWNMFKKTRKNAVSYLVMAAAFLLVAVGKLSALPVLLGCGLFGLVTSLYAERRKQK